MNAAVPMNPAAVHAETLTMHAMAHRAYGEPDVLSFEEVPVPTPGDGEVLVRVHAASVSIGDHHIVTGTPYVIRATPYGGFGGPKNLVPGQGMSGRVEAVGPNVTSLKIGDAVFGDVGCGAYAELVVAPASVLAPKPASLSFEEAAAATWAFAALQGMRDVGGVRPGQKVLVNGASGGVGTWAVQIAKALGAEVTGVCSTRNVEMVRGLGADHVIDYTREDFVAGGARFDVFFDTVGNRSIAECRSVVVPEGRFVSASGGDSSLRFIGRALAMMVASWFTKQKLLMLMTKPNRDDLLVLTELVEAGKARPVIEKSYSLRETPAALTHVGSGHTRGQVVVRVA